MLVPDWSRQSSGRWCESKTCSPACIVKPSVAQGRWPPAIRGLTEQAAQASGQMPVSAAWPQRQHMHAPISPAGTSSGPAGYGAYASSQPGNGGSVSPWGGKSTYTSASADDRLGAMFRAAREMGPTRHSPEGYVWEDADHERGPSPSRRGGSRPLNTMYDRWVCKADA